MTCPTWTTGMTWMRHDSLTWMIPTPPYNGESVSHDFDFGRSSYDTWTCRKCGATCKWSESGRDMSLVRNVSRRAGADVQRRESWDCDEEIAKQVHES